MSSDTPKSNHGAEVLKRSIADKHAVHDIDDVAGGPKDIENAETLMASLDRNRYGDLIVAPNDFWSVYDSLAEIRELRASEDE
jgi:hypothetical protein